MDETAEIERLRAEVARLRPMAERYVKMLEDHFEATAEGYWEWKTALAELNGEPDPLG